MVGQEDMKITSPHNQIKKKVTRKTAGDKPPMFDIVIY